MGWCSRFAVAVTVKACIFLSLWAMQASAKTVAVGGSAGWTNFDDSILAAPDYASWASSQTIQIGDSLVFKYQPFYHDVYMLPNKKAFDYCNFTESTLLDEGKSGSFTWIPSKEGVYYFACNRSVEGAITHCEAGQKVSIKASGKSSMQSPMTSPSLAPVMPTPSLTPAYAPKPLPIFSPSSTPTSPALDVSPQQSPTIAPVSISPSLSPTADLSPSASPSSASSVYAFSPNPILSPTPTAGPISESLSPSLSVSSPRPSSSNNMPFVSSTPTGPLPQVGESVGDAVPISSPTQDASAAGISVLRQAWMGLLLLPLMSYVTLFLVV
uniref:TSA: Wollemia nobilis Ref_Wollemi_Transcript_6168_1355 transcribed RNA sequence n=1 Tax=Wollemia nobilis TaxID=56998 RepID=A0A0C9S9U1_9CONI